MKNLITIALILLTFSLSAQLKSGLVGYWKFENNALDATKHDNDGTVNGATYTSSGKIGGCYDFDGGNDYVNLGNITEQNPTSMSFFAWVYIENLVSSVISACYFADSDDRSWELLIHSNSLNVLASEDGTYTATTSKDYSGSTTLSTNSWIYVGFTWDNGVIKIYYNGEEDTPYNKYFDASFSSLNNVFSTIPVKLSSNGSNDVHGNFFNGRIDEPMIWSRALTATEVKSLYNSGNGVYFVMENFRKDKDYEKLNKYFISRMYFDWIESAA